MNNNQFKDDLNAIVGHLKEVLQDVEETDNPKTSVKEVRLITGSMVGLSRLLITRLHQNPIDVDLTEQQKETLKNDIVNFITSVKQPYINIGNTAKWLNTLLENKS